MEIIQNVEEINYLEIEKNKKINIMDILKFE
jgi:hypothetical protein